MIAGGGTASFGPGSPLFPSPLDTTGQPRTFVYPTGWNYQQTQGDTTRIVDGATLRQMAQSYDILRKAIEIRKDEIASLDWDIVPRQKKGSARVTTRQANRQITLRHMFKRPDHRHSFQTWIRMAVEEILVVDALSLATMRDMTDAVAGWRLIDGLTIHPLLDISGDRPLAPTPAYQQIIYGYPRLDCIDADDGVPFAAILSYFAHNDIADPVELRYRPQTRRVYSPYGFSRVEMFLVHINNALRFQLWETAFWTDGNVPQALVAVPDNWTASQIAEFQAIWDARMSGNQARQRSLQFIPGGSQLLNSDATIEHSKNYADYLISMTCLCMDVTRRELGLEGKESVYDGEGKSSPLSSSSETHMERLSLRPLAHWLKSEIFDPILENDLDAADFEWTWPTLMSQNERAQAELNQVLVFSGQKSLDDVIVEQGYDPPGIGRFVVAGNKVLYEPDLKLATTQGAAALAASLATAMSAVNAQAPATPLPDSLTTPSGSSPLPAQKPRSMDTNERAAFGPILEEIPYGTRPNPS